MRILQATDPKELIRIMRDIHVDDYGIRIMLPKALIRLIRMKAISSIAANILKQEMLSLGGEVAVARGALTGKARQTDCLLMGSLAQYHSLNLKLKKQPFGLDKVSAQLSETISNYQKNNFVLELGSYRLNLGRRTHVMGIVNITPDSFSGDGLYRKSQIADRKSQIDNIVAYAERMVKDGADIIDVGGESSRPQARPVSLEEELKRTIPAVRALAKKIRVPVSIDTRKPEVARLALDNGALMINDITGLRNKKMARLAAEYKAGVVIMHMQGEPQTMQVKPRYESLIDDIIAYLAVSLKQAEACGVKQDRIVIDPGIGFGKTHGHNLEILRKLGEFRVLGAPICVGVSRKSFLGKILKAGPGERLFGTVSACVLAADNGASIVRVHDVKAVKEALKVLDAVKKYEFS